MENSPDLSACTKMNPPTVYLFVDLETGGLYYEKHAVYEIAAICTDIYFGEQYFRYTTPIKNSTAYEISDWALDQHNKNGLFQDIEDHGISLRDAEKRLLELLKPQLDNNAKIILAGSNISFDRGFLKRHMPDLESKLHYQMMDETCLRTFLKSIIPGLTEELSKMYPENHRAMSDIEATLTRMRTFRDLIRSLHMDSMLLNSVG